MAGIKGYKRKQSQYETHNYCPKCCTWIEGKPLHCPECNRQTRSHVRFKHGKNEYTSNQYRY